MRWQGIAYRGHDPGWAFAPEPGDGAAIHGGRFNPKGMPALYLALSIEGMLVEQGHGLAYRFGPLTVCAYDIDMDGLVDLRTERDCAIAGVEAADLGCAWRLDIADRRVPASWSVVRRLFAAGASGILVPSFATGARPGMANLVAWRWGREPPRQVRVWDPDRRLPRDQSSWRE